MPRILTKRFWERIAWFFAILVAVALLATGYFAVRADWRLKSRLAAIRAAGDPASIAELEPAPVPDDENAAAILDRNSRRLDQFSNEYEQFFKTPIGNKYEDAGSRGQPPSKEQVDAMRAILKNYPDVESAILRAAACEQHASRLDFSLDHRAFLDQLLDSGQRGRMATRFLHWRNEVLLSDGQQEAAIKNSIQSLRLGRLHENEPSMVSGLIAIAMRSTAATQLYDAIAAGPVSPALHAAIDQELALQDDPDQLARTLKSERAVCADWINSQITGRYAALGHVFMWTLKDFETGSLDALEKGVKLAPRPWHEVRGAFGVEGTSSGNTGNGVGADLMEPGLRSAFAANARCLAEIRALRIFNALRTFADKNKREAKGLEELNLPKAQTIDPFSGEPLKLKHTDDGWIVYSVMDNGVDDGGDFIKLKDFGVAPPKRRLTEEPPPPIDPTRDETAPVEK